MNVVQHGTNMVKLYIGQQVEKLTASKDWPHKLVLNTLTATSKMITSFNAVKVNYYLACVFSHYQNGQSAQVKHAERHGKKTKIKG